MKQLATFVNRGKIPIFVATLIAAVGFGVAMRNLEMNNDIVSFLDEQDPDVLTFTKSGNTFGSNYLNFLAFDMGDVFTHKNIQLIDRVTRKIEAIDGIEQVISLTTTLDVKSVDGGMEVGDLIKKGAIPSDPAQLAQLKRYVLGKEMYRGLIVNDDGSMALLLARIQDNADKENISRQMELIASEAVGTEKGVEFHFAGLPAGIFYANDIVLKDLTLLTPLVILCIVIVLGLSFRSVRGVVLPLLVVAFSTLFAVGLMALGGVPLTILSACLPVVLLSTGTAYGIHLVNADREFSQAGITDAHQRVTRSLEKVGMAVVLSALTTIFGFSSLITAELTLIRDFGIYLSLGIFFALLLTMLLLTSLLELWPTRTLPVRSSAPAEKKQSILERALSVIAAFIFRRKAAVLVVAALVAGLCAVGIPSLTMDVDLVNFLSPEHPMSIAKKVMDKDFGGMNPTVLLLDAENIKHPAVLRLQQRAVKKMRTIDHLHHPTAVSSLVEEMNHVINGKRTTPPTTAGVENLWLFIDGKKELKQMVNDTRTQIIIQGRLNQSDSSANVRTAAAMQALADTLPRKWASISRAALTPAQQKLFNEEVVRFVFDELRDDAAFAGMTLRNPEELEARLIALNNTPLEHQALQTAFAAEMAAYLSSDTADIEIADAAVRHAVVAALHALPVVDEANVRQCMASVLPPEIIAEEPGAADIMTEGVLTVHAATVDKLRFARLKSALLAHLPQGKGLAALPAAQRERLEGDLWNMLESNAWLPAEAYARILPSHNPATVTITPTHTGLIKIMANTHERLIGSQLKSLGIAMGLVLLLLAIQLRSLWAGAISMIPIVFTILVNFGIMSLFNISLDNVTMMIASIAIGIGVDYTIHITGRLRKELAATDDLQTALINTTKSAGMAVLINSLAVSSGFLVLLLSDLEPLGRFGLLTAITMMVSAIGAVTLFPAAVFLTKAKAIMRHQQSRLEPAAVAGEVVKSTEM